MKHFKTKVNENEIINESFQDLFKRYPLLKNLEDPFVKSINLILNSLRQNGKILVCGNGGSASDSEHIVGELLKGFRSKRKISQEFTELLKSNLNSDGQILAENLQSPIPAISLTGHPSFASAFANDQNYEFTFAQHLLGLGRKGDILLAITTSGNSPNVLWAAKLAKVIGIKVISLTGASGGNIKKYSDINLNAPSDLVHHIQELHLPIYHSICFALEQVLFD